LDPFPFGRQAVVSIRLAEHPPRIGRFPHITASYVSSLCWQKFSIPLNFPGNAVGPRRRRIAQREWQKKKAR
jgi:hypothetical protein